MQKEKRPLGLTLIAIGKLAKVLVLVTFGVLAIVLAEKDPPMQLIQWADALRVDTGGKLFGRAFETVAGMSSKKLDELGIGAFVYAALFATEGIGLWLQKKWAEYLTIVITISFIPLEIFEIAKHPSAPKIVTLVLNVAAVVYLLVRVFARRHEHAHAHAR